MSQFWLNIPGSALVIGAGAYTPLHPPVGRANIECESPRPKHRQSDGARVRRQPEPRDRGADRAHGYHEGGRSRAPAPEGEEVFGHIDYSVNPPAYATSLPSPWAI